MLVLGIESSCDETSCAIIKNGQDDIATVILTQIDIHTNFGGVVPEIASRHHLKNITMVIEDCLNKAKMKIEDTDVNIYDKERMLIELIRYKSKLPYELYKEVLNNYRKIKDKLNFIKLYKYAQSFNNSYIMKTIETEVM